ncbi:hypothetical protein BN2537_2159 [Streptomyces venezuelae]|nr:hypothetical protein BN2537_2159 [Streptomyces venezuelae]
MKTSVLAPASTVSTSSSSARAAGGSAQCRAFSSMDSKVMTPTLTTSASSLTKKPRRSKK